MSQILPVATLGEPILRQKAETISDIKDKDLQLLIDDMLLTCRSYQGLGIAAPQVLHSMRLFIMSSKPNKRYPNAPIMKVTAVINPKVIWTSSQMEVDWEGCLSLPNKRGRVARHTEIKVNYHNRDGEQINAHYQGFLARLFQHELDHLDGKLFIDRMESANDVIGEKEYLDIISKA